MPRIKEYQTQSGAAGPIDQPQQRASGALNQGLAQLGQGLSSFGESVYKAQEQQEVSDIGAKMAEAHANFTNHWQETMRTADPGDPTLTEKFMTSYDDYVGGIEGQAQTRGGKLFFQNQNAQMRSHFMQSAAEGQAGLAGLKAKEDYQKVVSNFSSSLLSDPSSFELAKSMNDQGVEQMVQNGHLPREVAIKMRNETQADFAKAAVRGWSKLDPEFAKEQIARGQWDAYLNGDQKHQMYAEADQELRARRVDQERQVELQKKQQKELSERAQSETLPKIYDLSISSKDIINDPRTTFPDKKELLTMLEHQTKGTAKNDPLVENDLFQRIHLDDGNPRKIVDEKDLYQYVGKAGGGIDIPVLNQLRLELSGSRTEEGKQIIKAKKGVMDQAEAALVKKNVVTGLSDPTGVENMNAYRAWFNKAYTEGKKNGLSDDKLLTPGNPEYLGNGIKRFQKSTKEIIKTMSNQLRGEAKPGVLPYKEGETAAEYLARVKGTK